MWHRSSTLLHLKKSFGELEDNKNEHQIQMKNKVKTITASTEHIAACGLYCGACRKYLYGKCPGCLQNDQASWCKIRQCCLEKGYRSCAECGTDVKACKTHNNVIGKSSLFCSTPTVLRASATFRQTDAKLLLKK